MPVQPERKESSEAAFSQLREQYNRNVELLKQSQEEIKELRQAVESLRQNRQDNPGGFDAAAFKSQVMDEVKKEYDSRFAQQRIDGEMVSVAHELSSRYPNVTEKFFDEFITWTKYNYGNDFFKNMRIESIRPTINLMFDGFYRAKINPRDGVSNSLSLNQSVNNKNQNPQGGDRQELTQERVSELVKHTLVTQWKQEGMTDQAIEQRLKRIGYR